MENLPENIKVAVNFVWAREKDQPVWFFLVGRQIIGRCGDDPVADVMRWLGECGLPGDHAIEPIKLAWESSLVEYAKVQFLIEEKE